ncbi:MAG: hypothetical protein KJS64_04935 [Acidobacteria bacterium]|nr:hypothetical protein [Acidobacteriota bacterium]
MEPREIAQRILDGDTSVIPGPSARYRCGWLQHPDALPATVSNLESVLDPRHQRTLLLGMGGSASGAGMLLEANGVTTVEILDTSHPDVIQGTDFDDVNVIASSKSGGTVETVCALAYALDHGLEPRDLTIVTDQGTSLHELGQSLNATVVVGDRDTGGRFSALSVFGLTPAVIAGVGLRNLEVWPASSDVWCDAFERGFQSVRSSHGTPTAPLRDDPLTSWAALWEEQLIAESTGKDGRGVIPVAGRRNSGETIEETHARVVGMCVALGVDPFDQPDVEQSKQITFEILGDGNRGVLHETESADQCITLTNTDPHTIAIEVFGKPVPELTGALAAARDRMTANGRVALAGYGPRYLHSTGQMFKGGPSSVSLLQIAVTPQSAPCRISGRSYSFHDLMDAQWRGDRRAMMRLGRTVRSIECDSTESAVALLSQLG